MCNTRSNVYLPLMKTYTLSVNTLTRNLTSERHDNCASCLGLILPIRWVTPPPNFCLKYFLLALHLQSLRIWFVFNINMASCLSSLCWFGLIRIYSYISVYPLQHSLIAMSSRFESFELSECDRTLTSLCSLLKSIYPNHMHSIETVECLHCVLVSRR